MPYRTMWLALSLLGMAFAPAAAQTNPTLGEAERGIRRTPSTGAPHLTIRALSIDAHVVGATADIAIEMLIASDTPVPHESDLSLRLPPGAVVNGYALDVGGRMIPGQLIEAPRARNVYEDEVRAGIDPGLAEVSGNRFATRIFPIDVRHPRRFRLTFAAPYDPAVGIVLPFERDRPVGTMTARVTVDGYATPPDVRIGGMAVALTRADARWTGRVDARDRMMRDGLTIGGGRRAATLTLARHGEGETFFVLADRAPSPAAPRDTGGRLRIYWDRSVSHRDAPRDAEVQTLLRLVDATAPDAIDLITFASDAPVHVALEGGAALRRALDGIVYRGGSSLGGLDAAALPKARRCVMVFDGQVTIDRAAPFAPGCRIVALSAAPGADGARLARIARRSGGAAVAVTPGQVDAAVAAVLGADDAVAAVRDAAGHDIAWRALPMAGGTWAIVGPMPSSGEVWVQWGDGAPRAYRPDGAAVASDAAGTLWAEGQLPDLADDPARHAAMVALARRYRVAGPGMSFLVLERPDQYVRADLTPPPGFPPEWLADYGRARAAADRDRVGAKGARLAEVLTRWQARQAWWARRFVPVARKVQPSDDDDRAAPPPPPPPAPMAPPPPVVAIDPVAAPPVVLPSAEGGMANDVVVTGNRVVLPPEQVPTVPALTPAPRATVVLADPLAPRPYLAALEAAAPAARLAVLAEQERAYATLPGFYLDVAEWFRGKGMAAVAELLLLSALDLPTSDDETRQIVAFRLERDGRHDRAVELAEHLAAANAGFRPQPGRDLALALAARGRAGGRAGRDDLERAFGLLCDAALNPASSDFDGIEVIALAEANALIPAIEAAGGHWTLDPRLLGRMDLDARIVIGWTADDADIDLWVNEPNGERVYYGSRLSSAGGQISNDMTDGYGPEEYAIRRAPAGAYQVRINGFDADRLNPNGPGHVLVRLYRNHARADERQDMVDVDLSFQSGRDRDRAAGTRSVATVTIGP